MRSVNSEKVRIRLADLVRVNRTEGSIRTGVTEVKCELASLSLNGHSIGRRRSEVDAGPSLGAEHTQRENFSSHQQKGRDHQAHSAAGKAFDLFAGRGTGKLPDKIGQEKLRGKEGDSGLEHRVGELLIDEMAVNRNVLRHRPHVHDDGNRRCNCDQHNHYREHLRHICPPLAGMFRPKLSNRRKVKCGDSLNNAIVRSSFSRFYFALNVKLAAPAPPAATVTFWVWVPRSSCHAVTV